MLRADLRRRVTHAADFLVTQSAEWERSLSKRLRRILDAPNGDAEAQIQRLLRQSDIVHVRAHIKYIEWTLAAWSDSKESWGKQIASRTRRRLPTFRACERMLVDLIELANAAGE
jgi:hypothetical protein